MLIQLQSPLLHFELSDTNMPPHASVRTIIDNLNLYEMTKSGSVEAALLPQAEIWIPANSGQSEKLSEPDKQTLEEPTLNMDDWSAPDSIVAAVVIVAST